MACTLVYLHPMMTVEEERSFYANFSGHIRARGVAGGETPEALFKTQMQEAVGRAPLIEKYLRSDMDVLEVGASTGAFLHAIRGHVAHVLGVEPSPDHAAHMANLGIETVTYLEDLEPGSTFDAVAPFHVLEHMRVPSNSSGA